MKIADAPERHAGRLCLAIALAIALVLTLRETGYPLVPLADGEGYASRAFALFGFLHTGQWTAFGHLLVRPVQSILPLHDLVFFLLPRAWASPAAYLVAQNLVTYLLLGYGLHRMCAALDRPGWAPALLLFVAVNNVALIDFYTYFLDMPFLALGVVVLAWQMAAWRSEQSRAAILAGVGVGLLFFSKPANALIFLATFFLAEIFQAMWTLRTESDRTARIVEFKKITRRWACELAGLLPLLVLAFELGGGQAILQLIDHNEIHETATNLQVGGLLRLFYFPLCLAAFYHVLLLVILIAMAAGAGAWMWPRRAEPAMPFPARYFIPLAAAYCVLGEVFSFWMVVKPMRSMLLVIPLAAIAVGWLWEKRRLRPELLFVVAVLYALVAFAQKSFDAIGTRDHLVEDNYQLGWSSWVEMPSAWRGQRGLTPAISAAVGKQLPASGIVCVNSIELRDYMAWQYTYPDLLDGRAPTYEWRYLFDFQGTYYDRSLVGASRLVLFTFLPAQSNRRTWLDSMGLMTFAQDHWSGTASGPRAQLVNLPSVQDVPLGTVIAIDPPLTQADVDQVNTLSPLVNAHKIDGDGGPPLEGPHYTRAEAWALLQAWAQKRF